MGISIDLGKIKFNWRGDWSPSTAYTKDDVVNYNGASFVCVANNTGNTPNLGANSSTWHIMLKGDGSFASSGMSNPQGKFRSIQNMRRRYYDYSEDGRHVDNVVNPYSLEQMWNDGRINSNGITNYTSHLTTSPWNGKQMVEIGWSHNNFTYGPLITVPAGTDCVQFYVHGSGNDMGGIFSLTDPSTGKGVCYNNCAYDNRQYTLSGWHTGGSAMREFGKDNGNNYFGSMMLMVPRLSYDKQYYLVRGHHGRNMSWGSGWVGGFSFQDNPNGFVWQQSGAQYERVNGGDSIWHNSWNTHEMMQMYIHYDHARTVKVPVAPRNNAPSDDRVLFFYVHGNGHDQTLTRCVINGKTYHLSTDLKHPVMEYLDDAKNDRDHYRVLGCVVAAEDIPANVRSGGGMLDVRLDNYGDSSQNGHNSHHWYFGINGTCYLEPESMLVDNGRTGRN